MSTFNHCIFIASNYTSGTRKGLDYLFNEANIDAIQELIQKYAQKEGVSVYIIQTDSDSIKSISEKEAFFSGVNIVSGTKPGAVHDFEEAITNQIKAFDVALLFLTRNHHSYKELNTILLICYLEYCIKFNDLPFPDKVNLEKDKISIKNFSLEKFLRGKTGATEESKFYSDKEDIVLSKYFNTDGGTELMNRLLNIYLEIIKYKLAFLQTKLDEFAKLVESQNNKKTNQPIKLTDQLIKNYYKPILF